MNYIPNERLYKTENLVYDETRIWTKLSLFNDIMEIDRSTGQARIIPLPSEYEGKILQHRSINKLDEKIYITPFKAREMLILDIDSESFEAIPIPKETFAEEETGGFTQSAIIGDWVVMLGYHLSVLMYNIKTGEFRVIKDIKENYTQEERQKLGLWSWVVEGHSIFMHIVSTNTIVELNVDNIDVRSHSLNGYDHIDGICGFIDAYYVSPYYCQDGNTRFILWNSEGIIKEVLDLPSKSHEGARSFSWMAMIGTSIYMMPGSYPKTYKFDICNKTLKELSEVPTVTFELMHEKNTECELNYFAYVQMGNKDYKTRDGKMITINPWLSKLVELDSSDDRVANLQIELNKPFENRLLYEYMIQKGVRENYYNYRKEDQSLAGLEGYLAYLTNVTA